MIEIRGGFSKLLVLAILSLLLGTVFFFIGVLLSHLIYGLSTEEILAAGSSLSSTQDIEIAKLLLLFNSLGLFLAPSILYAKLFSVNALDYLKVKTPNQLNGFFLIILLFLTFLPIINLTAELNKALVLPDFLSSLEQWMQEAENSAMELTKTFLKMENKSQLIVNILLIGLVPALGEELLFRGVIQQSLINQTKNPHFGIWLSAILFSAVHFQFYGFLPRMLIGAFLGYLFFWSSNIWFPIFAHFVNNAFAVVGAYYLGFSGMEEKLDKVGTIEDSFLVSLISSLFFVVLLVLFKRRMVENTG